LIGALPLIDAVESMFESVVDADGVGVAFVAAVDGADGSCVVVSVADLEFDFDCCVPDGIGDDEA
jgi:hypothetical protein